MSVRLEHGWLVNGRYICDGCAVREPFEHRCHGDDGGPSCTCETCRHAPGFDGSHMDARLEHR